MFKEGQVYKIKVELSPDLMGFGRATVISVESNRIYVQLRASKGGKLNVPAGTKIWFVGSSLNNKFNGLWTSVVQGYRIIGGSTTLECRIPKFEKYAQRRTHVRTELSATAEMQGDEWKDVAGKITTRNISRHGIGIAVSFDCVSKFEVGKTANMNVQIGNDNLQMKIKIVNSRFNWLLNRTEVGAEFLDMEPSEVAGLERILIWLGNRPVGAKATLSESGSLAKWIKLSKEENTTFLKGSQVPPELAAGLIDQNPDHADEISEEDFESIEPPE